MKTWVQKRRCYIIVLAGALLPRLILALVYPHSVWLVQDEIGALALPAKCAGLHWEDVIATTSYYGFGYYILFTPLFMLTDNFLLIQTVIRVSGAVLLGVSPLFCVWIYKNYFNIEKENYVILSSLISSYAFTGGVRTATNEYAIIFLLYLLAFILAKRHLSIGNAKKEIMYSGLLIVCLLYSLTIHTRMLICAVAFVVTVVFCGWIYKIVNVKKYIIIPVLLAGIALVQYFIKWIQQIIWKSNGNVNNSVESVMELAADGIKEGTSYNWLAYLFIIAGNLVTLFICSGMIMILSFSIIKLILQAVKKRGKLSVNKLDTKYILLGSFFGISTLMAIIGLAVTWGTGLAIGIEKGEGVYNNKAIHYIRYFGSYASPLLMVCLAFLFQKTEEIKENLRILGLVGGIVIGFWMTAVVSYMINSGSGVPGFIKSFTCGINEDSYTAYIIITIIMLILSSIWYICINRCRLLIPLALILALNVYNMAYSDILAIERNNKFEMADGGYELVGRLEEKGIKVNNDIYCLSRYGTYRYQALLPEYHIIPVPPEGQLNRTLVFLDNASDGGKMEEMGYVIIQLDENEWIAVCDKELETMIKECQETW